MFKLTLIVSKMAFYSFSPESWSRQSLHILYLADMYFIFIRNYFFPLISLVRETESFVP